MRAETEPVNSMGSCTGACVFVVVVVVVGLFVAFRIRCRLAVSISVKGPLRYSIQLSWSFDIDSGESKLVASGITALPVLVFVRDGPDLVSGEKWTFLVTYLRA